MNNEIPIIDSRKIMELIPHRYPFLMVDRIENYNGSEKITAIKNVSINEQFFQGHFPDIPIMPGVMIVEAMAQAASCLVVLGSSKGNSNGLSVLLTKIDKARFRRQIVPGDQLRMEIKKERSRGDLWQFYGQSFVEDKIACEASFAAMVVRLEEVEDE